MYYSALIGKPTRHSVSHILYEQLMKAAKIEEPYKHLKIDVEPKDLAASLEAFKVLRFNGVSVTLPHKLAVMDYLDSIDDIARELGAVNTIKVSDRLRGYNTDWIGISRPIKLLVNAPELTTTTIFGTGGAARAAIYASKQLGSKTINVVYRDEANDPKLADLKNKEHEYGITLHPYAVVAELVNKSQLIINATSAGMIGNEPTPFDLEVLSQVELKNKIFFEVIFNPLETCLIKYFRERGAVAIDGLWMMIYQGIEALSIWIEQPIVILPAQLEIIHTILKQELMNV